MDTEIVEEMNTIWENKHPGILPERIDPTLKAEWLAALRSRNYSQTRAHLKTDAGDVASFCCIGVACDITDPTLWEDDPDIDFGQHVPNWDGIDTQATEGFGFISDKVAQFLADANDTWHRTFENIADWIEVYL